MIANMNEVLLPAKEKKYAVGLFNAVNVELARDYCGGRSNAVACHYRNSRGSFSLRFSGRGIVLSDSYGKKSQSSCCGSSGSRSSERNVPACSTVGFSFIMYSILNRPDEANVKKVRKWENGHSEARG